MTPGDENSSQDMGRLVASADLAKDRTGACVLLIHHTGKSAARGARGHSSLRAAIDTEIEVTKEAGSDAIEAKATKQRDMMVGNSCYYRLREVQLGIDRDGDPITTCVVERAEGGEKPTRANLSGKAEIALGAKVRHLHAGEGGRRGLDDRLEPGLGQHRQERHHGFGLEQDDRHGLRRRPVGRHDRPGHARRRVPVTGKPCRFTPGQTPSSPRPSTFRPARLWPPPRPARPWYGAAIPKFSTWQGRT